MPVVTRQTETGSYNAEGDTDIVAETLAQERFRNAQTYADEMFTLSTELLEDMVKLSEDIITIQTDAEIDETALKVGSLLLADPPTMDTVPNFSDIVVPVAPEIDEITVDDLNSIPSFDVEQVTLNIPDKPVLANPQEPGGPPTVAEVSKPAPPVIVIPDTPVFKDINFPSTPEITLPDFSELPPEDDLVLPAALSNYNYTEDPYQSDLKDRINLYLTEGFDNPTIGIDPNIEVSIYQRDEQRIEETREEDKLRRRDEYGATGFALPGGVQIAQETEIEREYIVKRAELSSDIATKQLERVLEFKKYCVEKGLVMEDILIRLFNEVANRLIHR